MLEALRADFHRIPELLSLGPPEQPAAIEEPVPELDDITIEPGAPGAPGSGPELEPAAQLGLF
jgi:hypothetical protein